MGDRGADPGECVFTQVLAEEVQDRPQALVNQVGGQTRLR